MADQIVREPQTTDYEARYNHALHTSMIAFYEVKAVCQLLESFMVDPDETIESAISAIKTLTRTAIKELNQPAKGRVI